MKKITKAVIPAAGLGTRMLPIARTVPKEILPIVDKPAISYLVDEAISSGVTDILIITNRGKYAIEDYFDYSPEYEESLRKKGKDDIIDSLRSAANRANIYFIRQKEARGPRRCSSPCQKLYWKRAFLRSLRRRYNHVRKACLPAACRSV